MEDSQSQTLAPTVHSSFCLNGAQLVSIEAIEVRY